MFIPKLQRSDRYREYDSVNERLRDEVVYKYLFAGMSHRQLDEEILCLGGKIYEAKKRL